MDHRSLTCLREIPRRNTGLMSVSHQWMVAVLSYAPLWSTIFVGLPHVQRYPSERAQERLLNALNMRTRNFVVRSRGAPLYLQIHTGMNDVILRNLHDCLQRCRRLEVHAFANANNAARPIPLSDRFSNLEDLTITLQKQHIGDILRPLWPFLPKLAESGCRLKRLAISQRECDEESLKAQIPSITNCASLVSLTISNSMDPLAFAQLLLCCTYLRYVSYTRAATTALQSASIICPALDIHLPCLESLITSGEDDVLRCIARIYAPNLVNLEVQRTHIFNNPQSGVTTELPLWLAPNRGRFPNLRVMKLLHPVEWTPADLSKFFFTQPALEHLHIISLSTANVIGLLALADPSTCPNLNSLFIQVSSNALANDALIAILERLWVPRRQEHEKIRRAQGKKPFAIRINGRFAQDLAERIGSLFDVPPSKVVERILPYEIPAI